MTCCLHRHVQVRSWTPEERHYHGFLVTHDESISMAEYYTVPREGDDGSHPMCVRCWRSVTASLPR